jgi:hypothetical protein
MITAWGPFLNEPDNTQTTGGEDVRTIRKYPLNELTIPVGAHVLHCGLQGGSAFAWCDVDPAETRWQEVIAVPTGSVLPDGLHCHIGTVVGIDEVYVFHFYIAVELTAQAYYAPPTPEDKP